MLAKTSVPGLAGEYFMVTGSGKYFRNVILNPEDSLCIVEVDKSGENYRVLWGLVNGGRPTYRKQNINIKNSGNIPTIFCFYFTRMDNHICKQIFTY